MFQLLTMFYPELTWKFPKQVKIANMKTLSRPLPISIYRPFNPELPCPLAICPRGVSGHQFYSDYGMSFFSSSTDQLFSAERYGSGKAVDTTIDGPVVV